MGADFLGRLRFVAAGRDLSPWLMGYGFAKGTVWQIMNHGHLPKTDILLALIRAENVNLNWLLDGTGSPFRVHVTAGDGEALDYLAALFDERGWNAVSYTDGTRTVLVLTRPGEMVIRKRRHAYTIMEVVTGVGRRSREFASSECRNLRCYKIDKDSLSALARGETAGTYRLTQAAEPPFEEIEEIGPELKVAEAHAEYGLTDWERQVLDAARSVPAKQRDRVLAVLHAFSERGE